MITRLEIKNFRCFESLSLSGFKRFNLVVGESGSGKTALLETLFLVASGNPESFFRIRKWRGFGDGGPLQLNGTRESYEGLFRYIFHDLESNRKMATITAIDSNLGRRTLEMYFGDKETLDLSLKSPENSMSIKPIHFKYDIGNVITNIALEIKDGAMRGTGSADIYPLHFISGKNVNSAFDASLFSSISRQSRSRELVDAVRSVFDMVEDLSLEITGGETLIHAKIRGIKDKMPLNELSGGLNKFITIAVAIASNPKGVVAVDEIENGFYFKNQEQIISGLLDLCTHYEVQLFASTHSWEFLRAFAPVVSKREAEFSLIKASLMESVSSMRVVGGGSSISAINQDIEIRN